MPTIVVVPVKSFSLGKQRLAESLTPAERAILGKAMVDHVCSVVTEAGLIPVLVTADPEVATWAAGQAIPSIPDPGDGLDAAARAGVEWAEHSGSRWIVLHSDLPLLTSSELSTFSTKAGDGDVIAPSSDGGTSAIAAGGAISFSFGSSSFVRHLSRLETPTVVTSTGFLHDVDSPDDLTAARSHPRGRWIDRLLP